MTPLANTNNSVMGITWLTTSNEDITEGPLRHLSSCHSVIFESLAFLPESIYFQWRACVPIIFSRLNYNGLVVKILQGRGSESFMTVPYPKTFSLKIYMILLRVSFGFNRMILYNHMSSHITMKSSMATLLFYSYSIRIQTAQMFTSVIVK